MFEKYIERFKKKYTIADNGCWEWTGWKNHDGYGFFRYLNKKEIQAHRFSAKHLAGQDITNKVVCHKCDNPGCVNPEHLFVGTQSDNVRDMHIKKRHKIPPSQKGIPKQKYQCPHCDKMVGGRSNALRWHFDNCKYKGVK